MSGPESGRDRHAARLLIGDVSDRMRELPDHSVDLILTSPPFLEIDYGTRKATA